MMTDPLDPDSKDEPEKIEEKSASTESESTAEAPSTQFSGEMNFPAMGQGKMGEKEEKFWSMLGHLLSLSGVPTGGIGYIVGPLIPYLLKKDDSPFVDEHSRETLNFSILTFLVVWGSGALGAITCVVWLITGAMAIINVIFCIQGAIAAKNGEAYRYPFNWRIIK